MKSKYLISFLAVVAMTAAYFLWPDGKETPAREEKTVSVRHRRTMPTRRVRRAPSSKLRPAGRISEKPVEREKPVIRDLEEDEKLDSEMRAILNAIRDALNDADFKSLRKSLAKMRSAGAARGADASAWTTHIPRRLRSVAVEAIGYFGAEGIPELLDFVVDGDSEVAQDALSQLELAIQDLSLGDRGRAEIFKSLSSVLTDSEALDWMLSTATDARHSIGIETLMYIAQNGTPEAQKMVPDYIELFTGEEGISTVADANRWLSENPDEPDDEEFYGPLKQD